MRFNQICISNNILFVFLAFSVISQAYTPYVGFIKLPGSTYFNPYDSNSSDIIYSKNKYNWKLHGIKDGVATYKSNVPGTKLIGARGVTVLDTHISRAMGPFVNMTMAFDWVDLLKSIKAYPFIDKLNARNDIVVTKRPESTSSSTFGQDGYVPIDIVHQETQLPWPISPRDIVLQRTFHYFHNPFHAIKKNIRPKNNNSYDSSSSAPSSVTITYKSIEDERIPPKKGLLFIVHGNYNYN